MSAPVPFGKPAAAGEGHTAETLFYETLERPTAERERFLAEACGSDATLRSEVEGYLHRYEKAGSFLDQAAAGALESNAELPRLDSESPGDYIGPYRLMELIGEGGFGRVWVAEQERPLRRRVALKVIKLGMDTREVSARFEQERQALAMMEHPHIARVLDAGATPTGRPFFVMELVRGTRITDYSDEAQLSTADRLKLFIQVCSAVQHAHQKGVIHRDLKPSNVLVTLHDGMPVPKVIDFGVAKATGQGRLTDLTVYTRLEQMIGTPLYMAPEQAEMSGLDVDTRSDIYSLGVLLYELLTGRTPFDPEKLLQAGHAEMCRVIREDEPPRPSTLLSTMALERRSAIARLRGAEETKLLSAIRGDLDWIVMKALEKDRNRRYDTATGLARDIERHLRSEPVLARPPSAGYRFRRFVRRNRTAVGAGGAIAAALLVGTGASVWQAVRAEKESARARNEALRANRESERANAALNELRSSAPAFAEQAKTLIAKELFDAALAKLDTAIKLRPHVVEYRLAKGNLLQSQLRFADAAGTYREALQLAPGSEKAMRHTALSEKLAAELAAQQAPSKESLLELLALMRQEQRSTAELMSVSRLVGEEDGLQLAYWQERLRELPIAADHPISRRLILSYSGKLLLYLDNTNISNLEPLRGMPLEGLSLSGCREVVDLRPLEKLPLIFIHLDQCSGLDVEPLSRISTLQSVLLPRHPRNVEALRSLPNLKYLSDEADEAYVLAQTTQEFWKGARPLTAQRHAREGRFAEAERLLREQVEFKDHRYYWQALGAIALHRGDREAYARVAGEMRDRLSTTKGGVIATAEVCLLSPDPPLPQDEIAQWMQGERASLAEMPPNHRSWYNFVEGLREYRAGNPARSLELVRQVQPMPQPAAWATATVVACLAHQQLGNTHLAEEHLVRAREAIRAEWPQPAIRDVYWHDWLIADLLLQEAEKVIGDSREAPEVE